MKILILDNCFNNYPLYFSNHQYKAYKYYSRLRLEDYIKSLQKKKYKNLKIKIISQRDELISFKEQYIDFELFSNFRIRIDRLEFLKIEKRIIRNVYNLMQKFIKNTINLKLFHIRGLFLGKMMEYGIIGFFNRIFGEFEVLQESLKKYPYDKIILFNFNPNFSFFLKPLIEKYDNIEIYQNKLIEKKLLLNKISIINHFINNLYHYILFWIRDIRKKEKSPSSKNQHLLIYAHTQNQIKSTRDIFEYFKKEKKIDMFYYSFHNHIPRKKLNGLLKVLFLLRNILSRSKHKIYEDMFYEETRVNNILEEFFNSLFFFDYKIYLYNLYNHINYYVKKNPLSLVIVTNIERLYSRIAIKILKRHHIPTLYIPHAAISTQEEVITKPEVDFVLVPGEVDRELYIKKGMSYEKIFITGRPSYDSFYRGEINKLAEVKDMFNDRIYKFKPEKFSILLTTNPVDDKTNEIIISSVVNTLKELNLINNLIIKLHPAESGEIHKKILNELNVHPILIRDCDIFTIINSCNLLLSRISTTILEAMIIGIPTIALDLTNKAPFYLIGGSYQFMKDPILLKAINRKSLKENIEKLVNNKVYIKQYAQDLKEISQKYSFYDEKESPLEKTVKTIKNILNQNKDY